MPLSYDVVVMGGAISGAATAVLLRRRTPDVKILVVEKSAAFDWKVGESTVEISAYFLTRELKIYDHLSREQLPKQAFRYWFHNEKVSCLREASETGPTQLARTPSFQIDRQKLDEHVLALAALEGAEVWRPAKVVDVALNGEAGNTLVVEKADGTRVTVGCKWVVDATGRQAMLARKRGGLDADRVAPHVGDLGAVPGREGHGRRRDRGKGLVRSLSPSRPHGAASRHEPLHGLGLLDLVHSAQRRRNERGARMGHAPRPAGRRDAAREAHALSRREPAHDESS